MLQAVPRKYGLGSRLTLHGLAQETADGNVTASITGELPSDVWVAVAAPASNGVIGAINVYLRVVINGRYYQIAPAAAMVTQGPAFTDSWITYGGYAANIASPIPAILELWIAHFTRVPPVTDFNLSWDLIGGGLAVTFEAFLLW